MPDAGWYTILMGELRTGRTRTTTSPHQKTHATRASPRAFRCLVVRRPNELVEHPKRWASPLPSRRRSRRNIRRSVRHRERGSASFGAVILYSRWSQENVQSALAPKAMSKPAPLRARPTRRMPAHSRT